MEKRWLDLLEAGSIEALVGEIKERLPRSGLRRAQALGEVNYFLDNAEAMRYADFRQQGLFVGSGVVEAGCRSVIARRLKDSGMFWSVAGANAIIASRCCLFSNRFGDFWEEIAA
jgi:hypothetical protein